MRALVLRRTRPAAFAGAYEPLDAGPRTVAFLRGGDVLAAAAVRGDGDPRRAPRRAAGATCSAAASTTAAPRVELRDGIALLERT